MDTTRDFDFGYSWIWTYGHLFPTALFAGGAGIAWLVAAPGWLWAPLSALALWAFTGFLASRFVFRIDAPLKIPSTSYLAEGTGKVLDLGCGSGKTSIMIGQQRPQTVITALDNFSADYIKDNGKAKTLRNFAVAGIDQRAVIQEGDMLSLPFDGETFDAAVSSYAIDHLAPQDVTVALSEAYRVIRTGGEFLLMVIVPNLWTVVAYSPVIFLMFPSRRYWRRALQLAGFRLESEGSSGGSTWFLLRKSPTDAPANEALLGKHRSASFRESLISPVRRNLTRFHAFSLRSVVAPVTIVGLSIFLAALTMRYLGLDISWWWIAAAIPIGIHGGVVLLLLAGLLRWVHRRKTREQGSSL